MDNKIFISIASYKDKLLKNTILEAYNNARYKDRLVFGIFEQIQMSDCLDLGQFSFRDQIRYQRVDPETTKGVCWARKNIQEMIADEQYFLQIDAHTLFNPDWDQTLIDTLDEIKNYHPKCIMSGYPDDFNCNTFEKHPGVPNSVNIISNMEERNHLFALHGFHPPVGGWFSSSHKITHGYHLGACFIFSDISFAQEVPYDDSVFFGGEEAILSARAWTHGYNIFHISKIPLYHCWDKPYGGVVQRDYVPGHDIKIQAQAKEHIRKLVQGQVASPYGLGTKRSINDYMKYSGLDFFNYDFKSRRVIFETAYSDELPM
jgi:hypothetical protein